jgi:Flp pilus assembly protein TadG
MRERKTTRLPGRKRRHETRQRSQSGAVAVEAALITPLLVLLLFGITEFGMVYRDYLAVTSSVRAGARLASSEPRKLSFAQDAADQVAREGGALNMANVKEMWVYKADSAAGVTNGAPLGGSGGFTNCTTCVKFTWNGSSFVPTGSPTWPSSAQNACANDALHDSVGVYVKYDHQGITDLLFDKLTLQSHTVMSLEPLPSTSPCK